MAERRPFWAEGNPRLVSSGTTEPALEPILVVVVALGEEVAGVSHVLAN